MYNKIWRRRYGSKKRNFPVTLLIFASEGRTGDPTNSRIILRVGRVIYQYVLMRNTPEAGARRPGRSVPHPVRLEVSGTTADLSHAVEPDTISLRSEPARNSLDTDGYSSEVIHQRTRLGVSARRWIMFPTFPPQPLVRDPSIRSSLAGRHRWRGGHRAGLVWRRRRWLFASRGLDEDLARKHSFFYPQSPNEPPLEKSLNWQHIAPFVAQHDHRSKN
jgi:hypothetical protein